MRSYSLGRGRKKAVERFTNRQGLGLLVTLLLFGILIVYLLGYLHIDMD